MKLLGRLFFAYLFGIISAKSLAAPLLQELQQLQTAYPDWIQSVTPQAITWIDGTTMPVNQDAVHKTPQEKLDNPSLYDQVHNHRYIPGQPRIPEQFYPIDDPGRIRYEPFFRKMYGETQSSVEKKLVTIYWMPLFFGFEYPLQVTSINQVDEKLLTISRELEQLVLQQPQYLDYLKNPGGTFSWRTIAHTQRLSLHSFGMTIDINTNFSDYWQWDLEKAQQPIEEKTVLSYRNQIPWAIVLIFEKQGFIWGGKWYHYDTMHFEYRPELMQGAPYDIATNHHRTTFCRSSNHHARQRVFAAQRGRCSRSTAT